MPLPDKPTIDDLRGQLRAARGSWTADMSWLLQKVMNDATAIGAALGEISRDEALDALKAQVVDAIEALR